MARRSLEMVDRELLLDAKLRVYAHVVGLPGPSPADVDALLDERLEVTSGAPR